MPDLLFLVITVGFFAVAAGFVAVCDHIIGPDSDHGAPVGEGEPDDVGRAGEPAELVAPKALAAVANR